jgi:DinB family protein
VVEVICHLRDSDEGSLARTRLMRDQTNPKLAGRNQDQLAIDRNYAGTTLDSALAGFLELRATHLQELSALSMAAWERTGQHPSAGTITISGQIAHLVAHDAIHLAQIARQLGQIT